MAEGEYRGKASLAPMGAEDGAAPAGEILAVLDGEARRVRSPCGAGSMVWRVWGEGTPLVLLHGGYGSWAHWVRNIRVLASRFQVIAADMPGLGDSDMPPVPYSPAGLGAIIAEGIDAVVAPDARFHLVGFSFGGMLGGQVAARRGDQVRSLTIVGAAGLGLPRGTPTVLERVQRDMSPAEITELHRANLGFLMMADPANVDALAVRIQSENVARARVKSRNFANGDGLARVLPHVSAPLNGIWGEFDVTAYPALDARERLLRSIQPAMGFKVVPGAGHWVQYEAPDAFHQALFDLLDAG